MRLAAASLLCCACGRIGFSPNDTAGMADAPDAPDASPSSYAGLVLAAGPRIYLRLSEATGTIAHDASGHGEDAHYQNQGGGTLLFGVPGALSTDPDPAIQIDGTGAMTASTELAAVGSTWSNDFTLELFVRPTATPPFYDYILFLCENYMVDGFRFGWDKQNRPCMWTTEAGATGMLTSTGTVTRDVWNHVALVREGPTWSMYLDGIPAGSQVVDYNAATAGAACGFGAFHGVDTHAAFDEVAIYDRALTAAEIVSHVAAR